MSNRLADPREPPAVGGILGSALEMLREPWKEKKINYREINHLHGGWISYQYIQVGDDSNGRLQQIQGTLADA